MVRTYASLSRRKKRSTALVNGLTISQPSDAYSDPRRSSKVSKPSYTHPTNSLTASRKVKTNEKKDFKDSLNPVAGLEDSDSDDSQLIDVSILSSSPVKEDKNIPSLIDLSIYGEKNSNSDRLPTQLSSKSEKEPIEAQIAEAEVLEFDQNFNSFESLMDLLQRKVHGTDKLVEEKYNSYGLPETISSKRELSRRAKRHFPALHRTLQDGKGSFFYDRAKHILLRSRHDTMTLAEKQELDWQEFIGGYYGLKRQLFIGNLIASQLHEQLRQRAKDSRVVSYWTVGGFSSFVLANEVILAMIAEDFGCEMPRAEAIAQETVDYGTAIADTRDLDDDMDVGEFLQEESEAFMKNIRATP